jgi:hypothetical protein
MASHRLTPTDPSMAAEGYALFRDAYLRARRANPLLPALTHEHETRLRRRVERAFAFGGVAALRAGSLRGFMIAGPSFDFRGSTAALVPEYAHAVAEGEEGALVGPLYAAVAERLRHEGVPLHLIGHFAPDAVTASTLFELGFGAVVRERLRDLSDVVVADAARGEHEAWLQRVEHLSQAAPWVGLAPLAAEHAAFYRGSPLFVVKDASLEAAVADLEAHRAAGDAAFVVRDGDAPLAYLVVGPCPGETEGRCWRGRRRRRCGRPSWCPRPAGAGSVAPCCSVRWRGRATRGSSGCSSSTRARTRWGPRSGGATSRRSWCSPCATSTARRRRPGAVGASLTRPPRSSRLRPFTGRRWCHERRSCARPPPYRDRSCALSFGWAGTAVLGQPKLASRPVGPTPPAARSAARAQEDPLKRLHGIDTFDVHTEPFSRRRDRRKPRGRLRAEELVPDGDGAARVPEIAWMLGRGYLDG